MKKLSLLFAGILLTVNVYAQVPNKMSYQAVVRNASNALVAGKTVGIRISILQTSSTGVAVYAETHTPTTNSNGLATIEIGGGTVTNGTFASIDWSKGPFFIKTETDPTGGTNYTISATSQLLSVPFAMMANSSATANALSPTATGVVRSINGQGGSLILKGGGGTSISKNGDTVLVSSTGGAGGTGIQGVQSTDGIVQITNPNGPIATLNINNASIPATKLAAGVLPTTLPPSGAAGGDLGGTYPNPSVVKLQGRPIATTLPTAGQSLGWDGTQWTPSSGSSGWSLTGNSTINPATNYLGTSDNQPLIIKTNNAERLRVLSTGNVGIGTATPLNKLTIAGGGVSVDVNQKFGIELQDTFNLSGLNMGHYSIGWMNDPWYTGIGRTAWLSGYGGIRFFTSGMNRFNINDEGNVGIGITTPTQLLEVGATNGTSAQFLGDLILRGTNGSGPVGRMLFNNSTNSNQWSASGGSADFRISRTAQADDITILWNGGNVGIGTTAPTSKLSVNGTADKPGGGSWGTFSDARLKQDVQHYSAGLADVLKIHPVTYHYNTTSGYDTKPEYIGVIAQELQQVAPYMVNTFTKDGTEYLKVDNSGMTYMLVNAVKELSKQNQEVLKQNEALQLQLNALSLQMQALTAKVSSSEAAVVK